MINFFKKIFGTKETAPKSPIITAPLTDEQIKAIVTDQIPKYSPSQLAAASGQSVGKQRDHNEDSLLTLSATLAGNSAGIPFGVYIVADGMGGHHYGEVASNTAIRATAGYLMRKFHPFLFNAHNQTMDDSLQEVMQSALSEAQRAVLKDAPGSGTTLTAALVVGQQVTIAHIGDSRAYTVYPDGRMEAITRDHSLVKRLEELGQLSTDEAAVHPQRNVLYRALGQGETLDPDISTIPFPQGGYLLLCSDGLWGVVPEENIFKIIHEAPTLQRACQNLVSAANVAGGPDNISVILIQMLS